MNAILLYVLGLAAVIQGIRAGTDGHRSPTMRIATSIGLVFGGMSMIALAFV